MLNKIREDKLRKLQNFKEVGIETFPAGPFQKEDIRKVLDKKKVGEKVRVAGRIVLLRVMGNITFLHIQDESGKGQIVLNKKELKTITTSNEAEVGYKFWTKNLDLGDFIGIEGERFDTQKGEPSVLAKNITLLSKSILPLPDKQKGLQDEDERLRKRYLDILFNPDVLEMIKQKDRFWNSVRTFLKERNFAEVETPVLETTAGGADAQPFITHHNALDMDVYLRISMGELWQKRLMVAGLEKTFEIGRQFRNEGMDAEHLQDYTQMEFYWAYADYEKGMELVEEMYKYIAQKTFNTLKFKIGEFEVDLGEKWERYDYTEIIKEKTGVDINTATIGEIEDKLKELDVKYSQEGFNIGRAIDNLWKYCRKQIAGPGFLVNLPVVVSPLAKRDPKNKNLTQRFQPIIAGSELGNGYSELNDPIDQAGRFTEQQKLRDAGDEEAQMHDEDFVEALEYGMPPTCGFGMSERVFAFLSNKSTRECQIFPLMKPKEVGGAVEGKSKQTKIAVAIINKSSKMEAWQEINTVSHLSASFASRAGKQLLEQDNLITKDKKKIKLNIQHAIMIKETEKNEELIALIKEAEKKDIMVVEFTREMIETTDDSKLIKESSKKDFDKFEYLGVLLFGKMAVVNKMTKKFGLYK